ncbi:hypothetical protein ACGYLI_00035 [Sulfitobacter sp. 1A13421]|uniref:hypothetical protein n=1 Tax=Sulfitobacter sp. 1A13421 TaxID=3368595 RepID=UPI0037466358
MKLTAENHAQLEDLIDKILVTLDAGEVSHNSAIGALAHIVVAAAQGNEDEVRGWLERPETFKNWARTAAS